MAKKTHGRKLNRRAKRAIRRSVAAILMITSIVVAAIPVPDVSADTGNEGVMLTSTTVRDEIVQEAAAKRSPCVYDVDSENGKDDLNLDTEGMLTPPTDANQIHRSYTVQLLSNGRWEINWQFEYYLKNVSGGTRGIISKYNNLYQEKEVTLSNNAAATYYEVLLSTYSDFYSNTGTEGTKEHKFDYDIDYVPYRQNNVPSNPQDFAWFQTYFSSDFTAFLKACEDYYNAVQAFNEAMGKYLIDYKAWEDGNRVGNAPTPPAEVTIAKPTVLTRIPSRDFTEEQKFSYYCDNDPVLVQYGDGFTLVPVIDSRGESGSATASTIYLIDASNAKLRGEGAKDINNFLVIAQSVGIIGIGNSAFKDVRNVDTLVIPSEIRYIGDDAFLGSFIKSITFNNVQNIGNRAFKNCSQLTSITMGDGTMRIGTECFYGSGITAISLPYSVAQIGPGAFAECRNLASVDMSRLGNGASIAKYAFYNCYALNSMNMENSGIASIGEGAFAVSSGVTGAWTDIVLPQHINSAGNTSNLGDWLFAGRSNLKSVKFPADYGMNADAAIVLPDDMFRGCNSMEYVEFPDAGNQTSCGYVSFPRYLFLDVTNENFYVRGPERKVDGLEALPRTSTWSAISASSDYIPYVYKNAAGVDCYEVSDGTYLLQANANGELTSCTLIDRTSDTVDLVIPSYVGNYKITSVSSTCFSDENLRNAIRSITVEDDSINSIADNAFANLPKLEWIDIGNSVQSIGTSAFSGNRRLTQVTLGSGLTSIGNSAFEGCPLLTEVTFESPTAGYENYTIGTNAFLTGSTRLSFHGDIAPGFAPFDWAMSPDNVIDNNGTRVCYTSLAPYYLTVMYDNSTQDVTLLDYPRYDRLDEDHREHNEAMEDYYYELYKDASYDNLRANFQAAWDAATTTEEENAVYEGDYYGPWINEEYCAAYTQNTGGGGITRINENGFNLFPTLQAYAATSAPMAYYTKNPYSIIHNYEVGAAAKGVYETITAEEESWINGTLNVTVPSGVTSIDVYEFITGSPANSRNVQTYMTGNPGLSMYQDTGRTDVDGVTAIPGLFSGYYEDKADKENKIRGNDHIRQITLSSVTSLPDYAFDSCENLQLVVLGPDCADIGNAPFRGCDSMTTVGSNDYYKYANGIIYSVNSDETLNIESCLATRGNLIGQSMVNLANDPDLANVTTISPGAFEECDAITTVDLSSATGLKIIPEAAFQNCDRLFYVTLPESVNQIEDKAFAGNETLDITIPGKEVAISTDSFEHLGTVNIRSYEDSAAIRYAKYHSPMSYTIIDDTYRVLFLDHDGTQLAEPQYVSKGGNAVPPEDPVREGYEFTGWSGSYISIEADTTLVAQYEAEGGSGGDGSGGDGDGDGDGDGNNPVDTTMYSVTVRNGSGSGSYRAGSTVIVVANDPASGQVFDRWSTDDGVSLASLRVSATTFTMPAKNVTVTANYTAAGNNNNNNSGSNTISGNGNNNNSNSGSNSNGTQVTINRPGISNGDIASAVVNGSNDNFIIRITETIAATEAVENALTKEFGSLDGIRYCAMDISLYDSTGTTRITNTNGISIDITIPIPDALIQYAGNNKVAGVVNDSLDKISNIRFSTIDGVACVTFRATHFSPYTVYVDTNNLTAGSVMDSTPQTGDGIHPKWFLSIGLACLSVILFMKRDKIDKKQIRVA